MELGRDLNQAELDLVHYPRICAVCNGSGANQVGGECHLYCANINLLESARCAMDLALVRKAGSVNCKALIFNKPCSLSYNLRGVQRLWP